MSTITKLCGRCRLPIERRGLTGPYEVWDTGTEADGLAVCPNTNKPHEPSKR